MQAAVGFDPHPAHIPDLARVAQRYERPGPHPGPWFESRHGYAWWLCAAAGAPGWSRNTRVEISLVTLRERWAGGEPSSL